MVVPAIGRDIAAVSASCWWPPPRASSGRWSRRGRSAAGWPAGRTGSSAACSGWRRVTSPAYKRPDWVLAAQAAAILIAQLAA